VAQTRLVFFQTKAGRVPVLEWMEGLEVLHQVKIREALAVLSDRGSELGRPHVASLRDGIWELRVRIGKSRHRLLYFHHGRRAVILSNGLTKKEAKVPKVEIDRALVHKALFEADPETHTWRS
jgi:phage-related protein